ncbi:MAG: metal ABC transporter permease, partial [Acholeplasmatales bacterium]|nr:metal ABC transporter permease [Acholeplasmatales bacterium]
MVNILPIIIEIIKVNRFANTIDEPIGILSIIHANINPIKNDIILNIAANIVTCLNFLKKHSMIGDGLSHVGFGAVAIALAIGWAPLYFAIPIVILASFVILY